MIRKCYTKDNLTPDIECSLKAPDMFSGEAARSNYFNKENRNWQSAPCVAKTRGGRLFCCFSGDNSSTGDECPNNYNVIMTSDDGGVTWKENVLVVDHPDSVRLHEPILWLAPNGEMWHFWAQSYNWWDGRGGVWAIRCASPDAGTLTWSEPRRLCDGVLATPPIEKKDGAWLLPVSIWKKYKSNYHSIPALENPCLYASTDGGETFTCIGHADEPETTFDENTIAELKDGRLMMTMRTHNAIKKTVSSDGGRTWPTPVKLMDHCSARSYLATFDSGNLLLVANDHPSIRCNMTAFLSEDGGSTWPYRLLLNESRDVSYPAGCIDETGRVYVAYDKNRYSDREIYLASFTEEDIRAGRCVDSASFRHRMILKAGTAPTKDKSYENGQSYVGENG